VIGKAEKKYSKATTNAGRERVERQDGTERSDWRRAVEQSERPKRDLWGAVAGFQWDKKTYQRNILSRGWSIVRF
jgi:hypothetical protein